MVPITFSCQGAGQKESSEPLQLCISCTSQGAQVYTAVHQLTVVLQAYSEAFKKQGSFSFCTAIPTMTMPLTHLLLLVFRANGVLGIGT